MVLLLLLGLCQLLHATAEKRAAGEEAEAVGCVVGVVSVAQRQGWWCSTAVLLLS
jgi:hypothetical protein